MVGDWMGCRGGVAPSQLQPYCEYSFGGPSHTSLNPLLLKYHQDVGGELEKGPAQGTCVIIHQPTHGMTVNMAKRKDDETRTCPDFTKIKRNPGVVIKLSLFF